MCSLSHEELDARLAEVREENRRLSWALAAAPRIGDRFRDTLRYSTWYLGVRYAALHGRESRLLTEPPSYAATFSEKRKPRRG